MILEQRHDRCEGKVTNLFSSWPDHLPAATHMHAKEGQKTSTCKLSSWLGTGSANNFFKAKLSHNFSTAQLMLLVTLCMISWVVKMCSPLQHHHSFLLRHLETSTLSWYHAPFTGAATTALTAPLVVLEALSSKLNPPNLLRSASEIFVLPTMDLA